MQSELINKIEAVLFYSSEPIRVSFLAKTLEVDEDVVLEGIRSLEEVLQTRGLRVLSHEGEVSLVTAPMFAPLIEKIIKEERERDLGRAGIETLSIVAYKGPVTKKEIEYIRGVNSQYALRSLLLRGLVEKKSITGDERMVGYTVTADTLRFLGLSRIEDLPEYETMKVKLEEVKEEEIIEEENKNEDGE